MAKRNPIQHVEWRTRDAARLKSFYGSVFDWKFEDVMNGQYMMVDFGNKDSGGGIFQLGSDPAAPPPGLTNYITVEDLADAEAKITAAGGRIINSNQPVPGIGSFTIFADVDGNVLALWRQEPEDKAARKAEKKAHKAEKKAAKKAAKAEKKKKKDKKKK